MSSFYESNFEDDGVVYSYNEWYPIYKKACIFIDQADCHKITQTDNLAEMEVYPQDLVLGMPWYHEAG